MPEKTPLDNFRDSVRVFIFHVWMWLGDDFYKREIDRMYARCMVLSRLANEWIERHYA